MVKVAALIFRYPNRPQDIALGTNNLKSFEEKHDK